MSFGTRASAQELEPRLMSNVPRGMNFAILAYSYSSGNILLDPSLPVEDLQSRLHTGMAAYVRSIALFKQTGKIDVVVPFANGHWTGLYEGVDTSRAITGFGDPRVRLSWNSIGSPALTQGEFRSYDQETIIGIALQVIAPLGQYDPDRLINLGTNRWTFRPTVGISRAWEPWILEAYLGGWLFTKNSDFWGGNELTQDPLFTWKLHIVRLLPKGFWIAVDGGYGFGGRSFLNGTPRDTRISTFRFGATAALPVASRHTFKVVLASGKRIESGPDFETVAVSYQFRWGGR